MSSRRLEWLSLWLVTLLAPVANATTTIAGDGAVTRYPGGDDAYSGSLTLQQTFQNGGFVLGVNDTRFPIGSLAQGSVDVYKAVDTRFTVSGGLALGEANTGTGHDSTLYRAHLGVDARIDAQWSVSLADQYIDLDTVYGHVATVRTEYRPTPKWAVDVTGGYALSGTLADRYGQVVLNWFGPERLFGGVVFGRTGIDFSNLGLFNAVRRLFEAYAGAAMPVPHGTLTVSIDSTNLEGTLRQTIRIGFMEPIKP